jgi:hypothetical protein
MTFCLHRLPLGILVSVFSPVPLVMNSNSNRSKCRHCGKTFSPDYRNRYHQVYCSSPDCRQASKAVSHQRWLRQAQNRDYFRGPEQTRRVQSWRKSNPGYWKKKSTYSQRCRPAESELPHSAQTSCNAAVRIEGPLQDVCLEQNPLFIGLVSVVAGSTLQEDIVATLNDVLNQGRKILGLKPAKQCDTKRHKNHDCQLVQSTGALATDFGRLRSGNEQPVKRNGDAFRQSFLPGLILHD